MSGDKAGGEFPPCAFSLGPVTVPRHLFGFIYASISVVGQCRKWRKQSAILCTFLATQSVVGSAAFVLVDLAVLNQFALGMPHPSSSLLSPILLAMWLGKRLAVWLRIILPSCRLKRRRSCLILNIRPSLCYERLPVGVAERSQFRYIDF